MDACSSLTVAFMDGASSLGTATLNGSAQATFSTSSLTGGSHSVTAVYGADTSFATSTSSALSQQVNQASTTTTVASTPNPSTFGQSVSFTAMVTSGAGTPTGTVTFKDGSTSLGAGTLSSGQATFSTSALTGGSHSITAVYGADTNFAASTSAGLPQTVSQAGTATTVASSQNPSMFGNTVKFTATVTSGVWTPTGTLTFKDGGTTLGMGTLSAGQATFSTASLGVALHSITAVYGGDTNFTASTSSALSQAVNPIPTTTTLTSSANPVLADATAGTASVTLTATVSSASAGGSVQFMDMDGATTLGAAASLSGGTASTTVSLKIGIHNLTAVYGGDAVDVASAGTLSQDVYNTPTGSGVQVFPFDGTSPVTADSVKFSTVSVLGITSIATLTTDSSFPALPTNYVTGAPSNFFNLTTSATASGSTTVCLSYAGVSYAHPSILTLLQYNGTAWVPTTGQTNNQVATTICGTAVAALSTSASSFIIVEDNSTTTSLSSSSNPSVFGQSVTLTATITPSTATGTVTFSDNGNSVGTASVSNGTATFTTSQLSVATHPIQASYSDSTNFFSASSANLSQTVNQASTNTQVTSSPNPSTYGQSVTFTATVTVVSPGAGTPTGTVTFKDGMTTIGTGTLSSGQATFATSALMSGAHSITAAYGADTNFATSTSAALSQTVNQAATTAALISSSNPSIFGQSATFTASVSAVAPGAGTPTGTVTFKDGMTTLGTGTLSGGSATFGTSNLSVASHSVTAAYGGDTNFTTSTSSALLQTVHQASTTTTLTSSANPSVFGQSVSLTVTVAAVAPGVGTPTGTVTFMDGASSLGTATLNSSAQATFSTPALTGGSHSVTAVYGADTSSAASTSSALSQQVTPANTATTMAASPAGPVNYGQLVTLTATVTDATTGTPTSTVTFYDGTSLLGTGTLNGSGQTTYSTFTLPVGSHSFTAVNGGDSNFTGSNDTAAPVPLTVKLDGPAGECESSSGAVPQPDSKDHQRRCAHYAH